MTKDKPPKDSLLEKHLSNMMNAKYNGNDLEYG